MLFTEFQKEIIKSISNNDINNYFTMAEILFKGRVKISGDTASIYADENELPEIHKKLLDYYYVCNVLEEKSLIQVVKSVGDKASKLFAIQLKLNAPNDMHLINQKPMYVSDNVSNNIVAKYQKSIIIPSGELKQFIIDEFKSKEELHEERLINQQKESMGFTRKIAIASLIISIVTLLASLFISLNRKVEITNPGAFSDKVKVIIEKDNTNLNQGQGIKTGVPKETAYKPNKVEPRADLKPISNGDKVKK